MDIYVGNLAYATTDDSLRAAFEAYGEVTSARVVTDRISHRSKGFGFVEMPNETEAAAAVEALNGSELDGRQIRANESQNKDFRRDGAPGGGRGRFGGGRPPRREGGFGGREGGRGGFRREGGSFGGEREGGFRSERGGFGGGREGGRGGFRREGGFGSRGGSYAGPRGPRNSGPRGGGSYQPRESQW